jgi:hypothetical protein
MAFIPRAPGSVPMTEPRKERGDGMREIAGLILLSAAESRMTGEETKTAPKREVDHGMTMTVMAPDSISARRISNRQSREWPLRMLAMLQPESTDPRRREDQSVAQARTRGKPDSRRPGRDTRQTLRDGRREPVPIKDRMPRADDDPRRNEAMSEYAVNKQMNCRGS